VSSRKQAAVVQLAAFVLGAIVGPVCHLARHRADHTHGPDGAALALPADVDDDHAAGPHDHPQPHHHDDQPAELDHDHDAEHDVDQEPVADRDSGTRPALPLDHGHGSISHFGLALIGTASPLPLPRPERRDVLEVPARTAQVRLFHPSFPLPRPPPAGVRWSSTTDA
jgi:hypothetical protein